MAINVIYKHLPTVALRGLVVFPGMRLHFEVGRTKSIHAIRAAMQDNAKIFVVAQRDISVEDPAPEDLFVRGVVAAVKQIVNAPEGDHLRVVIEGLCRADVTKMDLIDNCLVSDVKERRDTAIHPQDHDYADALMRTARGIFAEYAELTQKQAPDVAMEVLLSKDPGPLADFVAGNALSDFEQRQQILEELDPVRCLGMHLEHPAGGGLPERLGHSREHQVDQVCGGEHDGHIRHPRRRGGQRR